MDPLIDVQAWSVYALVDPRDEQIRYIGKSVTVNVRLKAHLRERGTTRKIRWLQSLLCADNTPRVLILETGIGDWQGAEAKWIAHYRKLGGDLTNATSGGEGLHDPSPETRALIGSYRRAEWNDPQVRARRLAMYRSDARRAMCSAANKGRNKPYMALMPQNQKGYPWSDEERARRRARLLAYAVPVARITPLSDAKREHLRQMAENNRGKPGWARGRVLSVAERRVRSIAQKGRSKTEGHKEKIRQAALRRWARVRVGQEKETT